MFAGVSMDQSESAELTSPAGVGKFTFSQQPYEAIASACELLANRIVTNEPNCDSSQRC
jgi:hypothetical protein